MSFLRFTRGGKSAGWPCWVLFAAWFCANSPQVLTYQVILWAQGAQHFSHQERLQAEVVSILTGKKAPAASAMAKAGSPRSLPPSLPAEAVLKKLDLYAPATVALVAPRALQQNFPEWTDRSPDRASSEPLLPPPRAEGMAG